MIKLFTNKILCFCDKNIHTLCSFKSLKNPILQVSVTIKSRVKYWSRNTPNSLTFGSKLRINLQTIF